METRKNTLLLSFLLISNILFGQFNSTPRNFSNDKDFPQRVIKSIHQDKLGYMWFGMGAGLTKYDGYNFINYSYSSNNSKSIQNDDINKICSDQNGDVWLATRGGLVHYNYLRDDFDHYNSSNTELVNDYISDIHISKNGTLWLSTAYGLASFDPNSKTITPHIHKDDSEFKRNINVLSSLTIDDNGIIWCGTKEHGLIFFDPRKDTFIKNYQPFKETQQLISCLTKDNQSNIWVGYTEGGLIKYNQKTKAVDAYSTSNQKLVNDNILTILADKDVFIGTDGAGLCKYNPSSNSFTTTNKTNFHSEKVNAIYKDRKGDFWIGYSAGGIDFFTTRPTGFNATTLGSQATLLKNEYVADILKDANGHLWIANTEGGLVTTNASFNIQHNGTLKGKDIISLHEDSKGNIYIGTYKSGLYIYDHKSNEINNLRHSKEDINSIVGNFIFDIDVDQNEIVWCISQGNGVSRIDLKNGAIKNYVFELEDLPTGSCNWHFNIEVDRNGIVWIGSTEGLFRLNPEDDTYSCFRHDPKDPTSIISNFTYDLLFDKKGDLWIGTDRGLERFNSKSQSFQHISNELKMGNPPIYSVIEDQSNNMWLSSSTGLIRIDPSIESYTTFHTEDGLQGEQFNFGSKSISSSGELFFGGTKGYTSFYPDSLYSDTSTVSVFISEIKINNENINTLPESDQVIGDLSSTKALNLTHEHNSISISFLALNYEQPDKVEYAYMLEGLDKEWIHCNRERKVNYNFLPSGNYLFRVKASKRNGVWEEMALPLHVVIAPPFWLSTSAYICYLLLLISVFYFFRKFTLIDVNKKNKLQIEQLEKEAIEEMHQSKLRFYTDVSHEIRTPLTLIIDPINRLIESDGDIESIKQRLQLVQKNSNKMLTLVNQLLDFSKVDNGYETIKAQPTNLNAFLNNICQLFEDRATTSNIRFKIPESDEQTECWLDRDKIEKVATNLLSNAFKFTDNGGSISVEVTQSEQETTIKVSDSGSGIEQNQLTTIFNRYAHGTSQNAPNTGIGLSLTKRLIELHHGSIKAESNTNGSTFTVTLLNGNNHFSELEKYNSSINKTVSSPILPEQTTATTTSNKPQILLIEDEIDILRYLSDVLMEHFNVSTAQNGQEGLQMAQSIIPDLIVSDVMMPGIDGNILAKTLKSDPLTNHIPIILLTARSQVDQEKESLLTGADIYLTKPIDTEILRLKISNILQTRAQQQTRLHKQLFEQQPEEQNTTTPEQELLIKVKAIVEDNFNNPELSVDSLSNELGMSRTQLFRKFKAAINETPKAFIQSIRINHSKILLENKSKNITEIAYEVGFSDTKSFSRSFKISTGVSPSEFREKSK